MGKLISELSSPLRELAELRRLEYPLYSNMLEYDQLSSAISWFKTPEGDDFWENVYDNIDVSNHPMYPDQNGLYDIVNKKNNLVIQKEINELESEINKLKKDLEFKEKKLIKIINKDKTKRWFPNYFDKYFYVTEIFDVNMDTFGEANIHLDRYYNYNVFKTRVEAEKEAKIRITWLTIRDLERISILKHPNVEVPGDCYGLAGFYFTTQECRENAVKTLGENLYLLPNFNR